MSWRRADALLLGFVVACLALGCAVGLYRICAVVLLHVPLDPNEGWNAYHAAAALAGCALYPRGFFFDNYPPLSFYLVGAFGRLVGDNIFAGRMLSLAAFAVVTAVIAVLARIWSCRALSAAFGSLLFAAVLLVFSDYVGMNDPQLLGHAFQVLGLVLVVAPARSNARLAGAALLFAAGLFIKHNLFVLPLAVLLWLAWENRRDALKLGAAIAGLGIAGLVLFRLVYGTGLIGQLVSPRLWSFARFRAGVLIMTIPLAALASLALLNRRDRAVRFSLIYGVVGVVAAVVFLAGAGVDANAWFDAAIALSLSFALFIDRIVSRGWHFSAAAAVVAIVPLAAGLWLLRDPDWPTRDYWLSPMREEAQTAADDIAFLRSVRGPAICETLSLCYWAGKEEAVDVFNLGQAYASGAASDRPLIREIETQRYGAIEFETLVPFQLTQPVLAALKRNYRIARVSDDGTFFVPRPRPGATAHLWGGRKITQVIFRVGDNR